MNQQFTLKHISQLVAAEILGLPSVRVVTGSDRSRSLYFISFSYLMGGSASVELVTARGETRWFKSIDAAATVLAEIGCNSFEVRN